MAERILIVDDEPNITGAFSSLLGDEGYETRTAATAEEALRQCEEQRFDLILLDLNLPGLSGVDFLRRLSDWPTPPVVLVVSGQSDIQTALDAVRLGAADYLEKPVQPEKLIAGVRAALMLSAARRQQAVILEEIDRKSTIVGESSAIKKMLHMIDRAAPTDTTVLITGENGTGKELAATRLYLASRRREGPFVKVNCPGIPATLFESELFGHKKGAFTGAVKDYSGKFILSDGGTIFLDEIGDLPLECQAKLLRVLESGEVEQLGSEQPRKVDARIICATNQDLAALVADGKFREDLFYRISVLTIEVPPLRARREDIPLLVGEFLRRFDPRSTLTVSPDAMGYLSAMDYPGNVRQLKNIMERLAITCRDRTVGVDDIVGGQPSEPAADDSSLSLAERLAAYECGLIRTTLELAGGNISEAARMLHMDRARLSRRVKELNLK